MRLNELGSLVVQSTPSPTKAPTTHAPFSPPVDNLRLDKAPRLRMAALNQPFSGDMHGVRGADYECYRQSRRANLRGTFRAFLASRVQNLDSIVRFQDAGLPVVNLKGEVIFNAWKDVFTGAGAPFPYPPRIYSFDGRNVLADNRWSQKLVWHGSDKHGVRDLESYCDAWHSAGLGKVGMASSLLRGRLLDQERYSCNNSFIVLCIEATSQDDYRKRRKRDVDEDDHELTWEEFLQRQKEEESEAEDIRTI
ncbi:Collagen alpha-1(XVIII) chain [Araneus ventricosus]|uniref:Collagen alpha-1(XVIII) chain n=2 Tax=Araneus ventricosus TaxID=182803 RepID=A0A4Y2RZW6_ARAVE|nr:Collagen alpha-1(XVIII) chain [Araneus ventricosus]